MIAQLLLALGPLLLGDDPAAGVPLDELRAADVDDWRALVWPGEEELGHEAIPWLDSFAAGVRAAERDGRPLFFWAMNGHPLGCT